MLSHTINSLRLTRFSIMSHTDGAQVGGDESALREDRAFIQALNSTNRLVWRIPEDSRSATLLRATPPCCPYPRSLRDLQYVIPTLLTF
jgi:hypothetical protein